MARCVPRPFHGKEFVGCVPDVWTDAYCGKIMRDENDWIDPWGRVSFPVLVFVLVHGDSGARVAPCRCATSGTDQEHGRVLLVLQVGARRPIQLGGHSWVSNP